MDNLLKVPKLSGELSITYILLNMHVKQVYKCFPRAMYIIQRLDVFNQCEIKITKMYLLYPLSLPGLPIILELMVCQVQFGQDT